MNCSKTQKAIHDPDGLSWIAFDINIFAGASFYFCKNQFDQFIY
jgi:hypothetical protein